MVKAIILAGGRSSRLLGDTVKQFRRVNSDKMLITYSLESFIRCDKVDKITVVIEDEAWEELILVDISKRGLLLEKLQTPFWKARIYDRQSSVIEGIKAAYGWSSFSEKNINVDDIVVIHDASRPGITEEMITDCIDALEECDGAVLMNGTDEQTPAAFNARKYYQANMSLVNKVNYDDITELSMPARNADMTTKEIAGYEVSNISTEADWNAFEEKMKKLRVS